MPWRARSRSSSAQRRDAAGREIRFRIGINLGDVIREDHDIFGDGVNVAARLQEFAEPGGICVSGAVRDQVGERPRRRLRGPGRATSRTFPGRSACSGCASTRRRAPRRAARGRAVTRPTGHSDRQAVDRGPAVRQHERRSRAGVLRRRPDRGHHHRALALSRPVRDLAQLGLRLQEPRGPDPGGGGGAGVQYVVEGSVRKAAGACASRCS